MMIEDLNEGISIIILDKITSIFSFNIKASNNHNMHNFHDILCDTLIMSAFPFNICRYLFSNDTIWLEQPYYIEIMWQSCFRLSYMYSDRLFNGQTTLEALKFLSYVDYELKMSGWEGSFVDEVHFMWNILIFVFVRTSWDQSFLFPLKPIIFWKRF